MPVPPRRLIVALFLTTFAAPLSAHHSFATEFNAKKQIRLIGTVTGVDWINPHAVIHLNVKTPDGKVTRWTVQAGAPNTLQSRGLAKDTLKIGVEISVDGYQARDNPTHANARDVTLPDGRRLFLGSPASGAPYDDKVSK